MKKHHFQSRIAITVVVLLLSTGRLCAQTPGIPPASVPKGDRAPVAYFTGDVWVYPLGADSLAHWLIGKVTFSAGAHSNWHKHPGEQVVVVTEGTGYLKIKGQPLRVLHKGDIVTIPPGVEHWHGASPDAGFVQIVVNPDVSGGVTNWLTPVTEEEYKHAQ